ncbi:MAG: hypothetical protein C0445_16365, partial [Polaromonas sp.]|nr:hypothetical protein [Polaromonas sp.]
IKKGVMELADLVVINKADIDPHAATRARAQIMSSLRLLGLHGNPDRAPGRPKGDHAPSGGSEPGERGGEQVHMHHDQEVWHPQVIQLSALKGDGLQAFWTEVSQYRRLQTANGKLAARRRAQAQAWMWERIDAGLKQAFRQHPQVRGQLDGLTRQVASGEVAPSTAARQLLALYAERGQSVL